MLKTMSDLLWTVAMPLLVFGGIFLTVRTGFVQFRHMGYVCKSTIRRIGEKSDGGISSWQALTTALASTIGTGSITGVATAIALGGPGAVFWLWVSAILGMATKYSEIILAIKYRVVGKNGLFQGGPMYYIEHGLGKKWLAVAFAIFTAVACLGTGNMTQSNSIATAMDVTVGISPKVVGIVLVILIAPLLLGGIRKIAVVNSYLVPFMAVFYVIASVVALIICWESVPESFCLIFAGAFGMDAAFGGAAGYGIMVAMRYGLARGVFSNEAGLGSAPIAHGTADVKNPVEQAVWGVFEVAITMLVCTLSALVVINSGLFASSGLEGADLAIAAFDASIPLGIGKIVVCMATVLFAFSTILGWSYYGEQALRYLCDKEIVVMAYRIVYCIAIYLGACGSLRMVWTVADLTNALMILPNLVALLFLSGEVRKITKEFFKHN